MENSHGFSDFRVHLLVRIELFYPMAEIAPANTILKGNSLWQLKTN